MEIVYVNSRCQKILKRFLAATDYISLQQIADTVKVSKRSIYYDLCKINEWLNFYGLQEIEVQRGKGILISREQKQQIEEILRDENRSESYVFSPMERVEIIICYIVYRGEPVYIGQLSEYCQVSRNTIFNDLRVIVSQLQEYNLSLEYESKQGYRIEGDIIRIRALFFLFFNELKPLFDSGVLNFIDGEEVKTYSARLKDIEEELETEYVDGILFSLSSLLPLMYKSKERPYFPNLKEDEIKKSQEYVLVLKYFPDLDKKEQIYLCLHLLGSRVANSGNEMFDHTSDQTVYAITKALVAEFEKIACVVFEGKEELERSLFMHINTSLYRYQYGIQVGDPMSLDVMREYPSLVDITRLVSKYLVRMVGLPIPDSEVAYLALHFGAHLRISKPVKEQLRILIVCVNGVSTGNMMRREIRKLLPNAQIVDVVAAVNVENMQNICDLVISTMQIKSDIPVLVVHPILAASDRKLILNYVKAKPKSTLKESERLFNILKKYIKEEDYYNAKADMAKYFNDAPLEIEGSTLKLKGLAEFLQETPPLIVHTPCSWQEAIWKAGAPLLQKGMIEKKYLDTIIFQIQYYGPYMFIAEGVVLAHAKPEDGVSQLGVGFAVFKEAIPFTESQGANIIITLATKDQESHLRVLKDIMDVFVEDSDKRIEELVAISDEEAVIKCLQSYINHN